MSEQPTPARATQQRVVRVFISSTFRDMHAEREELVKRVFPQLRKLCESRGVTWGEVDLRWGVTDEQKAEGKVLPMCLAEIHNCRPYFICLLGERYGWVPDEIPLELIEQEPWLAEHCDRSVTELEILHGVLNTLAMADHAFFYFRSPSLIDFLPPEQQSTYREVPTPEEIERLGLEEATRWAEDRKRKLATLKARIRASGLPVRENYTNPQALGEIVLADLTEVINRLYPEGSQPDPLDREAAEHEAFAQSRARVYIGRKEYFDRLDAHAQGDGPPLVMLGESGMGKSALLANWAIHYRASHPDEMVLSHFIGASPYSTDWAAMLRRIIGEFKRRFNIRQEIPDQPDALRAAFANWLHMAAARGRVVLIFDALNQLEDRDGAPDLVWLPPEIPANVRLILSTLPGRPLEEVQKRGWPTLRVEPLDPAERRRLILEYLAQYTKTLSPDRIEHITATPQTANPLYLRALLEELRVWGVYERLDERIEYNLAATTVDDLYKKILARYEEDYERERPGLVRDAMSMLWAARRGLSESELLDLLGANDEPLPHTHWSPLYLAAEQSLVSQSGLIGFFHDYLREAVGQRYLHDKQEQQAVHSRLAEYFGKRDLTERKVDELPWQLAEATRWDSLRELLADLAFFDAAWQHSSFDVREYWTRLEEHSPYRMVDSYAPLAHSVATDSLIHSAIHLIAERQQITPDAYRDLPGSATMRSRIGSTIRVATLLFETGHAVEALNLVRPYAEQIGMGDDPSLGDARILLLNLITQVQDRLGNLDGVLESMNLLAERFRSAGDKANLATCLTNKAAVLVQRGAPEEAVTLYREAAALARETSNTRGLNTCLFNLASALIHLGACEEAANVLVEQERLARQLEDLELLQASLGAQAQLKRSQGQLESAAALLKEQEQLCRRIGSLIGLVSCLIEQGQVHVASDDLQGALALFEEAEHICRSGNLPYELQGCLFAQATVRATLGDYEEAMASLAEQEDLCRKRDYRSALATCLKQKARFLRGDLRGVLALLKEQEKLCRELNLKAELQECLCHQVIVLTTLRMPETTSELLAESSRLCLDLGNKEALVQVKGLHGWVLKERGDFQGALALYKEAEALCRELQNDEGVARCILWWAELLAVQKGKAHEALAPLEEALELARRNDLRELGTEIESLLEFVRPLTTSSRPRQPVDASRISGQERSTTSGTPDPEQDGRSTSIPLWRRLWGRKHSS